MPACPELIRVHPSLTCCDPTWEGAYLRFETPERERAKFRQRLLRLGADGWRRDADVVELFCGRGNALKAWEGLGFTRLSGIDLSESLLLQYRGPAQLYVCDARALPFAPQSQDIIAVQGGLHHLEAIPVDLAATLASAARALRVDGLFVAVEPWATPFLDVVHWLSQRPSIRRAFSRMDAFATMVERERRTYEQWLGHGDSILAELQRHFTPLHQTLRFGKLEFVGRKCAQPAN